jgi:hypothetical protein
MIVLLLIFIFVIVYLGFKNNTVENFENSNIATNIISFSNKFPFKNGGVLLNHNEGSIPGASKLLSKKSTISIAYSLYDKTDKGSLIYVPNNYCEIYVESKDEKINILLSYLNTIYHYQIDRYVVRDQQHDLIISLLLNDSEHELYVNNHKLYYYNYNLKNVKTTKYTMTSHPIIINKNKKLKGVLYGLITHNRILNIEEIKNVYEEIKSKFISGKKQKKIVNNKDISKSIKIPTRCNFDNKDICDNCSLTKIDLQNSKIIYQDKHCEDKITGYCAANKDYICDVIDITNKLGNN